MLSPEIRERIIALVRREVVPAIGCTEPVAAALCAARAAALLPCAPESLHMRASANILKNAMGVGIPGTGMVGLPVAIALGALAGRPELELEVLRDITDADVARARAMISAGAIAIELAEGVDKLHIDITASGGGHTGRAVISGSHTRVVLLERDGQAASPAQASASATCPSGDCDDAPKLSLRMVWDFATASPLDELRFILETRRMNKAAAEQAFTGEYGHCVGRTLHCQRQRAVMGDSIFSRILSYTSAACDARMAGAPIPVMSNSGSGNQGIAATLPVVVYAEETYATEEQMARALMLSHLAVIYIKQSLGRLSALCGCVVAATGSSCGIVYLMGGGYEQAAATVKNMVANLAGMICDGAKPSCSMKVASGAATAVMSAMMAMEGHMVTAVEGIVDDDVDQTIRNLTRIGAQGMTQTDSLVLEIMTGKCNA